MNKTILIIQHDKGDPPGLIIPWSEERNIPLEIVHIYSGQKLPAPKTFNKIIALGGPMNVDQHDQYPWLSLEKEFLSNCIQNKTTKILGLCLGGQLLARCLGATVFRQKNREIGWHTVTKEKTQHPALENWPREARFFQYHEDQFEIPKGAVRIFTNSVCPSQGFMFSNNIVGLQFHPEATERWANECLLELPEEYKSEPFVQTFSEAQDYSFSSSRFAKDAFYSFLDRLFEI